jgi:VWFA-related protein
MKKSRFCEAHRVPFLCMVMCIALGGTKSFSQPQASQSAAVDGVIQVSSQMVILDVVVTNRQNRSVAGLTQDDFTVYEDKVPQKIVSFEEGTPSAPGTGLHIDSTTSLDKLEPGAAVSILVIDELTTKFEDLAFARYSMEKYLKVQGDTLEQPTLLLAANYRNISVLHDYTTSRHEILSALQHHVANYAEVSRARNRSWQSEQVNAAFGSLTAVAQATAGHAGHKNIVWIGRGFPPISLSELLPDSRAKFEEELANCTRLLRDSRVTLYAVDPAGISAEPAPQDAAGFYLDDPFGGQVDFDTMAVATGGRALHGRNDVDRMVDESVRDGESFYTLAYRPSTDSQNAKPFRRIRIVMNDPAMRASTREGYFSTASSVAPMYTAAGKYSQQLMFDVSVARGNQLVYDGVPLTVTRDSSLPDRFQLGVWTSDLPLGVDTSQKPISELMVLAETFDKKGKPLDRSARLITVHLVENAAEGAPGRRLIKIPVNISTKTPATRIRFVVRANGNGKIGAQNFMLSQ